MLDAKRMCRKFKPIENQTNYISKYMIIQDREFRHTIERIIIECDYDSLLKEMLVFENKLLSMFNYNRPLLYKDCIFFDIVLNIFHKLRNITNAKT